MNFNAIKDFNIYNTRMGKGLMDKLFFVDKIEPDYIIDYGCADGLLLKSVRPWYPNVRLVGYDNDVTMVRLANEANTDNRLFFTSEWNDAFVKDMPHLVKRAALVLSSVVHEVYHYQEPSEVDLFWRRVFSGIFHNIVLRDMIPARSIDRLSDVNDVTKVYRKFHNTKLLQDFENTWGSIESNRNLVHFLLKYRYETPNWDREVKENYFPIYREDLLAMIPSDYEIIYEEHYVLPYIKRTVKQDTGIELKDPTHLKLILEKR